MSPPPSIQATEELLRRPLLRELPFPPAAARRAPVAPSVAVLRVSLDVLALAVVLALAPALWVSGPDAGRALAAGMLAAMLAGFALHGEYSGRLRLRAFDELRPVLAVSSLVLLAVVAVRLLAGDGALTGEDLLRLWLLSAAALGAGRLALHHGLGVARRNGRLAARTLIVGAGQIGNLTAGRLLDQAQLGLKPIGFLDKEPLDGVKRAEGALPVLGASWDLDRVVEEQGVRAVIITFSTAPHHVLLTLVRRCWQLGLPVFMVPRLFEVEGNRVTVEHLGGLPVIGLNPADPRSWQFKLKYAIDRLVGAVLVLALAPIYAVLALAVLVSMGRPIFYRQQRVGRDGRRFEMLKFRTMSGTPEQRGEADADWAAQILRESDEAQRAGVKSIEEWRTPLGRFMRRFSLDELPQLVNVLRGEMSLVGPRPERVSYVEHFQDHVYRYGERHRVKSGITGWAQVNGLRGRSSLADRIEWDNHYIENWSLWLDLKILWRTLPAVLGRRNAA